MAKLDFSVQMILKVLIVTATSVLQHFRSLSWLMNIFSPVLVCLFVASSFWIGLSIVKNAVMASIHMSRCHSSFMLSLSLSGWPAIISTCWFFLAAYLSDTRQGWADMPLQQVILWMPISENQALNYWLLIRKFLNCYQYFSFKSL